MSKNKIEKNDEIIEDFLEVDQPIPGQNYCCISFISPEKVIKQKEIFFAKHFLLDLVNDENKRKYLLEMHDSEVDGKKVYKNKFTYEKIADMYEDFRFANEKRVSEEYDNLVDFQTNVRSVKVRGVYDTQKEARVRAQVLQRRDPNFHVFVGQVGYWLPWDPTNMDDIDVEYNEQHLNRLMQKYKENQADKDMFYEEQKNKKVEEARKKAREAKEEQIRNEKLKTENIPKDEESEEKIKELRKIIDEKDKKFSEFMKQKKEQDRLAKANKELSKSEAKAETKAVKIIDSEEKEKTEKKDNESDDPLGNKSGYSDPWMQRKMEGNKEISVPAAEEQATATNPEVVFHQTGELLGSENAETGAKPQDNQLDKIIKNIF